MANPDEEYFIIRLVGGPFAGDKRADGPWPLPEELPDPELRGVYVKVGESQVSFPHPNIIRGARYEWHARDEETPVH